MKKRKDGRYQKKVTLDDGRQRIVYGRTIAEVNQAADALREQAHRGLAVGDTTTVDAWAKIWFATYKSNLRANTLAGYRNAYNNHILPRLAALRLQDVRPVHVQAVMLDVGGLSEALQHKVLNTMRQLFATAYQNGLVVRDPTAGIKVTPHNMPKKKEYLTLQEQDTLMSALRDADPRARCFVGLCLYCGLRREEALGLQWQDIQGNQLTVNRASTFLNNNQPDPDQQLKSKASHRVLPVPQVLADILAQLPRSASPYLLTCTDGRPMTQIAFWRMWDKVRQVAPCEVRPHQLRHSYCSNLYRAGIDLKTAQYLMGHATIQMTSNIYTHMEKEDAAAALTKLETYLQGGSQPAAGR